MADMSKVAGLQDVLRQQKGLQSITSRINAATGIRQMIAEICPLLIDLFRVEAAHVFVREKNRQDVYTFTGQTGDVKTVLGPQTLPGYIANEGKMIHISDFNKSDQIEAYRDFPVSRYSRLIPIPAPRYKKAAAIVGVVCASSNLDTGVLTA